MAENFLALWQHLLLQLQQTSLWYQLAAIALSIALAVLINRGLCQRLSASGGQGLRHVALRSSHRILLPLSLAALLALSQAVFSANQLSHNLLQLLVPIALALGAIRLLV